MKITEFSLRNPLIVFALTLAIVLFGVAAYLSMGVGITPNVSFPLVIVTTTDPGADPATIETQVTKPIENAVATLPDIDTITSTSDQGVSSVDVQFTTNANPDLAPVDVERALSSVRNSLPAGASAPSITTLETSAFPVITVAVSGPQSLDEIQNVVTNQIEPAFSTVPGVQSVSDSGGQTREIHVLVDPSKLEAYGIGLNTIQAAIQSGQVQVPAGTLTVGGQDVNVRLNALVTSPDQLDNIIVTQPASGPVYLKDVATVVDSHATTQVIDRVNGVTAVTVTATKSVDANTLAVSKGVREAMARLQPNLPQGMRMDVVTDTATYTQQSFNTIQRTLIEAVIFTGLILLLFLHTWRSTLIVLVSIPTSLLTTFGAMDLLGMNLNLFSMLAVTLSVGILVDDSIVVIENIDRHLGLGEPPILATLTGRSEIGLAALTITLVDVVVWVPIALISGIAGDFMRPYALVVAAATLTSLLVSFTLTPLLASRFLHPEETHPEETTRVAAGPLAAFGRAWDRGFERLGVAYRGMLRALLVGRIVDLGPIRVGARWAVIAIGTVAFFAGVALFASGIIGIDIFPSGDQSEVDATLTMPPATDVQATSAVVEQMEQKLKAVPEVRTVYTASGQPANGFTASGGNIANLTILLVPPSQRDRSSAQIADDLRARLDPHLPNARLDVSLPNAFGFGGFGSQPIQVAVQGPDPSTLDRLVDQITAVVQAVPGTVDVNNQNQNVAPQDVLDVNRPAAADLGVTAADAGNALQIAVDGLVVGEYVQPGQNNVDIRLMTAPTFFSSPANLANLPLLNATGQIVHLGQIGTIVSGTAPTQIAHVNRERSVTIAASVSGRTIGAVQQEIQQRLAALALPPGYSITYQGQAAQGASAFDSIFIALGIALVLMYMLMMMLFGSVTIPIAVLMSLPLAIVGALGALALTGSSFTLFSLLGIAMLVGLVGKNAILLVDYTDTLRKRGEDRTAALLEAGPTRLRPIVMTTLSVFTGLAPVALGVEAGSELLRSAALVMMGGLLTSTLLTLVVVPALYTIFDDIQEAFRRRIGILARPRPLEPRERVALYGLPAPVPGGAAGRRGDDAGSSPDGRSIAR